MSDWIEKAKDFLRGHPDRVDEGPGTAEQAENAAGDDYSGQVVYGADPVEARSDPAPEVASTQPPPHPGPPPQPGPAEPPAHPSPAPPVPHPGPGEPTVPTEPAVPTQPTVPNEPVMPPEPPFPVEPVEPPLPDGPVEPPLPAEPFPSEGAQPGASASSSADTSGLPAARQPGGPTDPEAPNPL